MDGQTVLLGWVILSAVIATIGMIYEMIRRPHEDSGDLLANVVVGWIFLAIFWFVLLPIFGFIKLTGAEPTIGEG